MLILAQYPMYVYIL